MNALDTLGFSHALFKNSPIFPDNYLSRRHTAFSYTPKKNSNFALCLRDSQNSFGILTQFSEKSLSRSWIRNSLNDESINSTVPEPGATLTILDEKSPLSGTIISPTSISEVSSSPASFTLDASVRGPTLELGGVPVDMNSYRLMSSFSNSSDQSFRPKWFPFAKSEEEEKVLVNRCINGFIVGVAATAAFAKIVTVDSDVWRGWTFWEVVRSIPIDNWLAYEASLQSNPVLAKMCISGTVYSLGDWSAQCCEGRGILDFDRGRMLRSGTVGFLLHGSLSHYYYYFCEWLIPFEGWWVVPVKVAFDQTIWSGLWNSIYYATIGLLRLESPKSIFEEIKSSFFSLLVAGWKLWPFAHIVTYGVIPVEQRLLWVDMVELVWVTILSMMSNEKAEARKSEDAAIVDININDASNSSTVYAVIHTQSSPVPNTNNQDSVLWSSNMVDQMVVKDVDVENVDSI